MDERAGLAVGQRVDKYRVLHRVGVGGVGEVYAAVDEALGRTVALKCLRPRTATPAKLARRRARLLREAQALARLAHPNVVPVYEVAELDGQVLVAMELVEGQTLRAWLQAAPRRWPAILDLCLEAGRGLAAAHAAGIVHRDVKPDNLLIGRDGRVRLIDFGLALAASDAPWASEITGERIDEPDELARTGRLSVVRRPPSGASTLGDSAASLRTGHGKVLGTPAYMSPEQARGAAVDARADQYAFCLTVWEALIGERPPAGPSARPGRRPPAWLLRALTRGLAPEPERRYADVPALLAALTRARELRRKAAWLLAGAAIGSLATAASLLAAMT